MMLTGFSPGQASAGIGLYRAHYSHFLKEKQPVPWLEVQAEDFLNFHTPAYKTLERMRADYPMSLHAANLSLGSSDGIDEDHVRRLKALMDRINPFLVSDHLSWGRIDGYYLNDVLPVPYTQEALGFFVSNISRIQDIFERPILIKNPASYFQYHTSDMEEPDFLAALVSRTGSGILLDIKNLYVSSCNQGWSTQTYLQALPAAKIKEIHLGGHTLQDSVHMDDHASPMCHRVHSLYHQAISLFGPVPTLVEWDTHSPPPLETLIEEAAKVQTILHGVRMPSNTIRKEHHVLCG